MTIRQSTPLKELADPDRLRALRQTFLLDTKAEAAFDRLTSLSARVIGAPISLITLVDDSRQFFKSAEGIKLQETPLSHSFCQHVVKTGERFVVEDARKHPLVRNNKAIVDFDVIGYLGMPLHTSDGYNIGALCVIDNKPRQWTDDEIKILEDLSSTVMMEIELRVQMRMEQEAGRDLSSTDLYGELPTEHNRFGVYAIERKIGRGGMSDVYQCRHQVLGTSVAVKELRLTSSKFDEFLQRFEQEAKIIAQLKHPNIIRVFDYGTKNDTPYMVMEYIHGVNLDEYMSKRGALSFNEDGGILLDIAEALDYAHTQGIIHRDIKPSNVMLRQRFREGKSLDYHATLMDFGIAKLEGLQSNITADNLVGTVNYMSPEQIQSNDEIDYHADLYSFGVLTYQFLTGRLPFQSDNFASTLNDHLHTPMPDPRQYNPTLTLSQVEALEKMLAKNPADRPETARQFITMLAK